MLRGAGGEIVFVEVKRARSHAAAAGRIGPHQARRLMTAAAEYLSDCPAGMDTECRFDAALVDGAGQVRRLENVFA